MIAFLFFAALLFIAAAVFYWWVPEHKINNHGGDAFAAAVVEPRNQSLYKRAVRQEENLLSLFQLRHKRLRTGLDLQHLVNNLQRKELEQAIDILSLDHRYHLELKRQLQLMTPPDPSDLGEVENQDKSEIQETGEGDSAEIDREANRRDFESAIEDIERINEWREGLVEAHGAEQADRMYQEFLRRADKSEFD